MTADFARLEQLFDAALEVPPDVRAKWLDDNCAVDEVLQCRLEQLLVADETNSDGMPDEPAVSRSSEEMPMRVGVFTPIRVIGEGGMGVVFEATQEGTGRSVALKLVRAGLATPNGMRRFRQEGQLLARLNHPGIAHVYDAGTARAEYKSGASSDRLFIAIELIDGTDLLEYAAREKLSSKHRVEIIEQLAHAMQHAHQRRVLHRDLKPSNILVDKHGQPKILDFGIGRLISPTNATGQTMTGQILGTAQYMSPEQASGDLASVDTRTDVYSLGVMLYELLAGQPAYDLGGLSAIAAARRVAEEEPRRLASLIPECRGDLDAIVHKAIERNPDSRYESADALASDLRRHLNDEVIDARSPTTLEAAWKYARRNRTLVGGVAGTLIALILGVIGTSIYGLRAAEQHRIAEGQRTIAEGQRRVAVWESYRLAMQASASAIELGSFDEARDALDRAPAEHRGWEHAHISSRLDQWLISFDGEARGCPCVDPDETRVLSALDDGRIGVWDITSGKSIGTFDLGTRVYSLARAAPGGIGAAATDGRRHRSFLRQERGDNPSPGQRGRCAFCRCTI